MKVTWAWLLAALLGTVASPALAADYLAEDAEMNRVYAAVRQAYADDAEFLASLKIAQQAWLAFRDAHLESRYPGRDKRVRYGSVYPDCAAGLLAKITRVRTEQLRAWLRGLPEGEVCTGSIRIHPCAKVENPQE